MRNHFLLCGMLAFAAAALQSCSNDDCSISQGVIDNGLAQQGESKSAPEKVQITLRGIADGDAGISKTHLTPNPEKTATGGQLVYFDKGDAISVWDGSDWNAFSADDGGATAEFTGTATDVASYTIVYPYKDGGFEFDGTNVKVTIPATQTAVNGSFDPNANVSVAISKDDGTFQLLNVCSLLKIVVPAGAEYKKIVVTSNDGSKIAGTISVDPGDGTAGTSITNGTRSITLSPASGSTIGDGDYYVALIPQALKTGLRVLCYNKDNEFFAKYCNRDNLIMERSKGKTAKMDDFDWQGIVFDVNGVELRMVPVTGNNNGISDFYIGDTEVTQALFEAATGETPSYNKKGGDYPVENNDYWYRDGFFAFLVFPDLLNRIFDAYEFDIPSAAEWVYAAHGGQKGESFKYSGSDVLDDVAWYSVNSGGSTHEAGTKLPNGLGIFDMAGNVYEVTSTEHSYSSSFVGEGCSYLDNEEVCIENWDSGIKDIYQSDPYINVGFRLICRKQ